MANDERFALQLDLVCYGDSLLIPKVQGFINMTRTCQATPSRFISGVVSNLPSLHLPLCKTFMVNFVFSEERVIRL